MPDSTGRLNNNAKAFGHDAARGELFSAEASESLLVIHAIGGSILPTQVPAYALMLAVLAVATRTTAGLATVVLRRNDFLT